MSLLTHGWFYLPFFSTAQSAHMVFELAQALGRIYVPPGCSSGFPLIKTQPTVDADDSAPFDQPAAIGWHNDFSTHKRRPVVSLAWIARADPLGLGAWRVASCDQVLTELRRTPEGMETVRFLEATPLPFSFTRDDSPTFFRVVEQRGVPSGRLGLRFYGRAIRQGALLAYGEVPPLIEHAVSVVESATDNVGKTLHARTGSLLVVDNWHAFHDRQAQSAGSLLPLRCSWLCFLESLHGIRPANDVP
ncbi:TauD/TfdA family dioxygenase [Corallococcus sp. BB11-1]|uniref:TauD/TfdA family dioxygenase n=1 Tax=Corallococcus sp. BB11-1 TaxID=2996783 RepID=UPI00226DF24B|nr:TauD/TfdA family dioxygenase [Corallococcus sp. BB11-1]MCY1031280.1 TauD/TfdA family dioxygenase [Corallococcus sp. BB11-1]